MPEPAAKAEPAGTSGEFAERRDAFVSSLRARVDAMEEQLDKTTARGAQETELQDTKARIDKLQEDLDELRSVSANAWWDVSSARVGQYIERVDRATYERPALYSEGIRHVLVGGTFVVRDEALVDGVAPGRAIRSQQ